MIDGGCPRFCTTPEPSSAKVNNPGRSTERQSRAEASLQVGVRDCTVEETEGSGAEQFPAGTLQRAERGSGEAAAEADSLDARAKIVGASMTPLPACCRAVRSTGGRRDQGAEQ